jgi:hypothetical protein
MGLPGHVIQLVQSTKVMKGTPRDRVIILRIASQAAQVNGKSRRRRALEPTTVPGTWPGGARI